MEKLKIKCYKCGNEFEDFYADTPYNERIYCNDCIDKMRGNLKNGN